MIKIKIFMLLCVFITPTIITFNKYSEYLKIKREINITKEIVDAVNVVNRNGYGENYLIYKINGSEELTEDDIGDYFFVTITSRLARGEKLIIKESMSLYKFWELYNKELDMTQYMSNFEINKVKNLSDMIFVTLMLWVLGIIIGLIPTRR